MSQPLPFRPLPAIAAGAVGGLALIARETLFPRRSALEVAAERSAADVIEGGTRTPAVRYAVPLGVGAAFALGYAKLWERGRLGPGLSGALALGLVHGLLTAPAEPFLRRVRPEEYADFPGPAVWIPGVVVDHLVFALATVAAYRALSSLTD